VARQDREFARVETDWILGTGQDCDETYLKLDPLAAKVYVWLWAAAVKERTERPKRALRLRESAAELGLNDEQSLVNVYEMLSQSPANLIKLRRYRGELKSVTVLGAKTLHHKLVWNDVTHTGRERVGELRDKRKEERVPPNPPRGGAEKSRKRLKAPPTLTSSEMAYYRQFIDAYHENVKAGIWPVTPSADDTWAIRNFTAGHSDVMVDEFVEVAQHHWLREMPPKAAFSIPDFCRQWQALRAQYWSQQKPKPRSATDAPTYQYYDGRYSDEAMRRGMLGDGDE